MSRRGTERTLRRPLLVGAGIVLTVIVSILAGLYLRVEIDRRRMVESLKVMPAWLMYEDLAAAGPDARDGEPKRTYLFGDRAITFDQAQESISRYAMLFRALDRSDDIWGALNAAQEYYESLAGNVNLNNEDGAELSTILPGVEELLESVGAAGAAPGPAYRLMLANGAGVELPNLSNLRAAARILTLDARLNIYAGNYDTAFQDMMSCLRLGDALTYEPIMISQLIRIYIHGMTVDTSSPWFDPGMLTESQENELLHYLATAANRHALAESFRGEALLMHLTLSRAKLDGMRGVQDLYGDFFDEDSFMMKLGSVYGSLPLRPMLNADEARLIGDLINAADIIDANAAPDARVLLATMNEGFVDGYVFSPLSDLVVPGQLRAHDAQAELEAKIGITRLGFLVERYHAQHGAYPETLDVLETKLGEPIPVDPMSGGAFHYEVTDGDFLLYSVGRDREDDGGIHNSRYGDMVWRSQTVPMNESTPRASGNAISN